MKGSVLYSKGVHDKFKNPLKTLLLFIAQFNLPNYYAFPEGLRVLKARNPFLISQPEQLEWWSSPEIDSRFHRSMHLFYLFSALLPLQLIIFAFIKYNACIYIKSV